MKIKHGYAFKGENFSNGGKYVVLTPGNFYEEGGFRFREGKEKYYKGNFPEEFLLKKGNLLIVMTEQMEGLLGSPAIVPEDDRFLHNQRLGLVVEETKEQIERKFMYYIFNTSSVRKQISATANGAKVRHTSPARIYEVKVRLPPLQIQRKISWLLSKYEVLIDNNSRRIRLLEQMAKLIYDEWFVKFGFPGHEKVKMVDSEVGEIPEGWNLAKFSEMVEIDPKTPVRNNERKIFIPMAALSENSMLVNESEFEFRMHNGGSKFRNGDTLFARITPSLENGKMGFVQFLRPDEVAIGSTEFIVLRSRTLNPYYVYFLAHDEKLRQHAAKSMAGASGRQRVQTSCFDSFYLPQPRNDALAKFASTVEPIFLEIDILSKSNAKLRQTRDFLRPKLISGEMDVSDLDIKDPEVEV